MMAVNKSSKKAFAASADFAKPDKLSAIDEVERRYESDAESALNEFRQDVEPPWGKER